MNQTCVGGPLLGARQDGGTFAPLVTNHKAQRFILLPSEKRISVLAYKTGRLVATLQTDARISSVVSHDDVVLAGCDDGALREFASEDLVTRQVNAVIEPRRIYRIAKDKFSVVHLTAVASTTVLEAGRGDISVVLYALLVTKKPKQASFLVRVLMPKGNEEAGGDLEIDLTDKEKDFIGTIDTFKFTSEEKYESRKVRPFSLSVVTAPTGVVSYYQNPSHNRGSVFVVLAGPTSLTVYYDPLGETMNLERPGQYYNQVKMVCLGNTIPPKDPLSCCQIAPNGTDLVCGHDSGMIRVLNNVLSLSQEFCLTVLATCTRAKGQKDKSHPSKQTLIRKVHWHAHPVASMAYDCSGGSDAILYSGGEESVLLTWQLARGFYRPANTLPRIGLGGILHILYTSGQSTGQRGEPGSILVYCSDNSLQLFQPHNYNLIWKLQGLAASGKHTLILPSHVPTMIADQRREASKDTILMSGLPGAPGYIHWYDPKKQCVVNALEVAPFNRVSRTEADDTPMPSPTITHAVWSQSGGDLVTVDIVGSQLGTDSDTAYGAVSTLKFWSAVSGGKSKPYEIVAAMTHPHGSNNKVSAVALSADGQYACTVSNDEKAFRLWRRATQDQSRRDERKSYPESERSEWTCRCKVTTPSGYSNFCTGKSAAAFSTGGSVLAIAFGGTVAMWNHHDVTLLTSLRHGDDENGEVQSVQFLDTNRLADVLLIQSSASVALRSPYGNRGPAGFGWNWTLLKSLEKNVRVSCAEFLPFDELVAIALYSEKKKESRILLVDSFSGKTCRTLHDALPVMDHIKGEVHSMVSARKRDRNGDWTGDGERPTALCLYVLTDNGEMIALDNTESKLEAPTSNAFVADDAPKIPTLPLLSSSEGPSKRKRKLSVLEVSDLEAAPSNSLSLEHFGGILDADEAEVVPTTELPLLRGAFCRIFVSRHLQRR